MADWAVTDEAGDSRAVPLDWLRFGSLVDARSHVGDRCCIYVQADREGRPLRVGKASRGLHARYRGGTGWALEAAMHGSDGVVFIAVVPVDLVDAVEASLIHTWQPPYNQLGKRVAPPPLEIVHSGDRPTIA